MHRTHTCGELRQEHIGQTVTLSGWVQKRRDLGGMIFIDLRDRYGVTQITLDPQRVSDEVMKKASEVTHEWVIKVTGEVVGRPDSMVNQDMATGAVEIVASDLEVLNRSKELPFMVANDPNTSEENRYKHRYIDLRRRPVLDNIEFRAKMNHFVRNWFVEHGFLEVQTPLFTVSSPEGARDYLIPSRVNPGKFYALPQAPQQYKQLLMVWWIDKYFQIAPCFRDEDPRADRHSCEFYQIDAEMSFVEQDDIFAVAESFVHDLIPALVPNKEIVVNFQQIAYHDAMDRYGSDKPDLRFGMELINITDIFKGGDIKFLAGQDVIKCIKLDAEYTESISRKVVDSYEQVVKLAGAGGLPWIKWGEELTGSIGKLITPEMRTALEAKTDVQDGDILFLGLGNSSQVAKVLNKLRLHLRDEHQLVDDNQLVFAWITDFPFYEYDETTDSYDLGHNPFSHVVGGLQALESDDLGSIQTNQYDMVLNGYEILSGSIRNHDPEVLVKVFEKIGLTEDDVKSKFGAMYEAFQYGCPPHGGFAFWFDRLMMILLDETNIRECYAFPKSGRAEDIMMGAPSEIDETELRILNIKNI